MSIPPRFLEEIRNRVTLSELIGKRIKVTRAGREYKACCPFHREKTPSFTINDDKRFYHCFGCGAHGDVVKFVMEHDGLPFIEAVEVLSAEAGLQMPKFDPKAKEKAEKEKDLYALMDEATIWMQKCLNDSAHADVLAYLDKRGLDATARQNFRIGYAPADGQALRKYLAAQGYSDKDMITVGLLKESTKGGEPYIFFRDRVMFPVADRRGKVVAFGGRILPDHLRPPTKSDFTPPKYINTPETPLFDKGRMLYGENLARPAAREGHTIIVTEGYMDVIACYSAGFKGAVAPMGTALTDDQIASVWAMAGEDGKEPVLCFDGDNAGRRAASRACENLLPLLKAGKSARFAFLPEGEDPDSLLKASGQGALKKVLQSSYSLFDFIWASHTTGRSFDTPESRAGLDKTLNQTVANIQDAQVQRHYKELVRNRISDSFFKSFKNKKAGARSSQAPPRLKPRAPAQRKTAMQEKILLAAILNNPPLYQEVEDMLGSLQITHTRLDNLRQNMLITLEENPDIETDALCSILKSKGFEQEIDDIASESVYVHAAFCRPDYADKAGIGQVAQHWKTVFEDMHGVQFDQEIKQGWKDAWENSDEEKEGQLKDIMQGKKSEAV